MSDATEAWTATKLVNFKAVCEAANKPLTQSLLYDLNLLPEQTLNDRTRWFYTVAVILHMDRAASPPNGAERDARWISVEERLPAVGEQVLIWQKRRYVQIAQDSLAEDRDDGLFWSGAGDIAVGECVTHWQPMPTPPVDAALTP